MPKLTIVRRKDFKSRLNYFNVVVDNEKRGMVRNDETLELELASGTHTLYLETAIKNMATKTLEFKLTEGENKTIYVKPTNMNFIVSLPLLIFLILFKTYLPKQSFEEQRAIIFVSAFAVTVGLQFALRKLFIKIEEF
jgi:hypothetical protein